MVKRSDRKDGESEIHGLKRENARLRIAYMTLYQQYLDLDAYCNGNGHHDDTNETLRKDGRT